jgi:hypothetical protein
MTDNLRNNMLSANQIATDRECEHTSNNGQLTQLLLQVCNDNFNLIYL